MKENGLSSKEVKKYIDEGKVNTINNSTNKTVKEIVKSNVFTYFNLIFAILGLLLLTAGAFKNLFFLPVIVINILIGIFQQIKAKKILDELSVLDISKYIVVRDSKEEEILATNLVLNDIIKLEAGQQIPADATVIYGSATVNESLLTGEANEIDKKVDSELKSGSFVVSGEIYARLTHVGSDSYVSKLTAQAKEIKEKQSEMVRGIERIIKVAGFLIIPIGLTLLFQSFAINHVSYFDAIPSMVSAVMGLIPEGLYLLVTISLALSAARLAKLQVLLHDMRSIEALARVDVLCVDKTGTITSDIMNVSDIYAVKNEKENKELLGKYINTMTDNNLTMKALREYIKVEDKIDSKEILPFNSKLKYSEIKTNDSTYRLGAPEFILDKEKLKKYNDKIDEYANEGKRVLTFAEIKSNKANPLLFIALTNELRANVKDTFNYFQEQGITIKVISGDNPLTVSKVALRADIKDADKYIDASTLNTYEEIKEALKEYVVFGRVKPEQKKQIVDALKELKIKVAMTGDGVNDILAMKEADCSIAMGQGSEAARSAAQVVLLDNDFSRMKNIIGEGRRNINNITRSASLFLYKNIFSLLLALFSIIAVFNYPLKPNQIGIISVFNIGVPAFFLAFEPNEKKQEGRFIIRVLINALPAALTSFFSIVGMLYFANLFSIPYYEVASASVYLMSLIGFTILYDITKPLNIYHIVVFIGCLAGFILCVKYLHSMFDIDNISIKAISLCIVFAFAQMSVVRIIKQGLNGFVDIVKRGKKLTEKYVK